MAKTSLGLTTTTQVTNYALTEADDVVYFNIASDATATLPNAATVAGKKYTIKRIDSTASVILSIATVGVQTIDGRPSLSIRLSAKDSIIVKSNGSNWIALSLNETFALQYQNTAGTSIAYGVETVVPFATTTHSTHPALWNGSRFTATFPIKILVCASICYPQPMGTAEIAVCVRKNGSTRYGLSPLGESGSGVPAAYGCNTQCIVDLQTNDYIEITTWQSVGNPSKTLNTGAGQNIISISKVGNL